jgi:hypothetical protein
MGTAGDASSRYRSQDPVMQKMDWSTGVEGPDHGKDAAVLVGRLQDPRPQEDGGDGDG